MNLNVLPRFLTLFLLCLIVFPKGLPKEKLEPPPTPLRSLPQLDVPKPPEIQQTLKAPKTRLNRKSPEEIAHYLWKHFSFESDRRQFGVEEYWQTPEEFVRNKKGDCEDFALFAQKLLKDNGFSAFILNVYGNHSGHTIVTFKEGDNYRILDGVKVRDFKSSNFLDIPTYVNPFWEKSALVDYGTDSTAGRILKMFHRS